MEPIPSTIYRVATQTKPAKALASSPAPETPNPVELPKDIEEKLDQIRKTTQRLRGERDTANGALAEVTKSVMNLLEILVT
jgi:hypothetical protein